MQDGYMDIIHNKQCVTGCFAIEYDISGQHHEILEHINLYRFCHTKKLKFKWLRLEWPNSAGGNGGAGIETETLNSDY